MKTTKMTRLSKRTRCEFSGCKKLAELNFYQGMPAYGLALCRDCANDIASLFNDLIAEEGAKSNGDESGE